MSDDLQDVLYEGENLLWQGSPDKFCFMWRSCGKMLPLAILWLLIDGFFISTTFATGLDNESLLFLVVFFAIHLLPVWKCVGTIVKANIEHKNVLYAVTDKRVITRYGVVGLDFENINYADISNVRVDVTPLEKWRGVGSVYITSSSGLSLSLLSVEEPYMVYKKINKVFMDIKSDIHFPNAYRPSENPGYSTKYSGKQP